MKATDPELWEVEIAVFTQQHGVEEQDARALVVSRWMLLGDFRPLAAEIEAGRADPAVLAILSKMIRDDRLILARRRRGNQRQPSKAARDLVLAHEYRERRRDGEAHGGGSSDEDFREIAKRFGVSEQIVRQAVTRVTKRPTSAD